MRICDVCKKETNDGFCVYDSEYYCSDDCLCSAHSPEDYNLIFERRIEKGKFERIPQPNFNMNVFNHNYQKGRTRDDLL